MINRIVQLWTWLTEDNMKKLAFVGGFIATLVGAGWTVYTHWSSQPVKPVAVINLIAEGDSFLDIGRYAKAKQSFQEALKTDPQDEDAAWGLKKAELWETNDTAVFEKNLQNLYAKNPKDPHVNLFLGKLYVEEYRDVPKALSYYQKAIAIKPNLPEAHFGLGLLYDHQPNQESAAKKEYELAATQSAIPKYRNNLAYFYVKHRDYERAIETYGKNSNYPLSALELAKIYWIRDELPEAENYQRQALQLLNDAQNNSDQEPWYLEVDNKELIELIQLSEKKDYAHFCLSVSLYLQGKDKIAKQELSNLKSIKQAEIKTIIEADLKNLVKANGKFIQQVKEFEKKYLKK